MRWCEKPGQLYKKYRLWLDLAAVFTLILYPMTRVGMGLSVVDTTYSAGNALFFPQMEGTWVVATFLSNVLGWIFTKLPFGGYLLGLNIYTSLTISLLAATTYLVCKKWISAGVLWLGEIIAIGCCWCPTTILYNYLTYLLMGLGILLIWKGLFEHKQICFVLAGVCLGANVAARMPNVVQAAFILVVWYFGILNRESISDIAGKTVRCILGYFLGFGIPFVVICVRYGITAYPDMIQTMFAMTRKAQDYKPTSMLTGMLGDYIGAWPWVLVFVLCVPGTAIADLLLGKILGNKLMRIKTWATVCAGLVLGLIGVRLCWGRGMFDLRYYNYGCIYEWVVLFLIMTLGICIGTMASGVTFYGQSEAAVMAFTVLLQILLTPLGSNNGVYPIMNNLFLAAPFALWLLWRGLCGCAENTKETRPRLWCMPAAGILIGMLFFQSIGFHAEFALQDGVWGEPRNSYVTLKNSDGHAKTAGIRTEETRALDLGEIMDFALEEKLAGKEAIFYGEVPGLGYFLDMPSALTTLWPDLDSYCMVEYERDMAAVEALQQKGETLPYVVVSSQVAAWYGADEEAMDWFGVDRERYAEDEKLQILTDYMDRYGYKQIFANGSYAIYE